VTPFLFSDESSIRKPHVTASRTVKETLCEWDGGGKRALLLSSSRRGPRNGQSCQRMSTIGLFLSMAISIFSDALV
jgi:hypothetical protein